MSPQMEGRLTDRRRRRERVGGTYLASAGKRGSFNVVVMPESGRGERASRRKTRLTGREKATMYKLHLMLCITSSCVHLAPSFRRPFVLP